MIAVHTITGPAFAASYLINGDASGLTEEDKAAIDAWCEREGISRHAFVDCEEEARFTWHYGLHFPEGKSAGGNVLDYRYHTDA